MNDQKPRIGTYSWSKFGRVGIWNSNYDEFGNVEDQATTGQWEVLHGHRFAKGFNSHAEATAYVREQMTA